MTSKKNHISPHNYEGCLAIIGYLVLVYLLVFFGVEIASNVGAFAFVLYIFLILKILSYLFKKKRKEKGNVKNADNQRQQKLAEEAVRVKLKEEKIRRQEERQREAEDLRLKQDEYLRKMQKRYFEETTKRQKEAEDHRQKREIKIMDDIRNRRIECDAICSDCPREKQGLPCIHDLED